ncbi:protein-tyrosine phosphatase-like protein [Paraphoma chrysanthemicola]|nr:protein-tyrosine phosphatase-like protein [Paraphoma chrysanthemicola]
MSYLLYGSTTYTGMGWVDQVPRAGKLYIGGLYALYQTDLIRAAGITHVLSVIDYDPLLQERFGHLKHFHVRADDHPNENLLPYFEDGVRYIDGALREVHDGAGEIRDGDEKGGEDGGGVFVHCAMGKSRSATLVVAYLIWKYGLSSTAALEQLCEGRPVCDPNPGFKEQLEVWERMCKTEDEAEKKRVYDEWEKTRFTGEYWEWDVRKAEKAKEKEKARL